MLTSLDQVASTWKEEGAQLPIYIYARYGEMKAFILSLLHSYLSAECNWDTKLQTKAFSIKNK